MIDLDGATIYANETLARMYGIPRADVHTLTVFDTLDDAGEVQFAAHLTKIRSGAHVKEAESLFHDRLGVATWILVRENLLRDDAGQVTAIVHRISDFGARRRLIDELVESRAKLQKARQIARLRSWTWAPQTAEKHVADDAAGSPVPSPEVALQTLETFLTDVHPRDQARVRTALRAALDVGDDIEFDARMPGTQGRRWLWIRVRGIVTRDDDGRVNAMTGTHQDVTTIKATERALRLQIEQNSVQRLAVTAANEASDLVEAMVATCALAREQLLGDQLCGYVVRGGHAVLVSGEETPAHADLAARGADAGTHVWAEDRHGMAAVVASEGHMHAVITYQQPSPIRRDQAEAAADFVARQLIQVAERDLGRAALALARDEATAASRQKSEFLTTVSHEIRTPLNAVIGLNDLLLATPLHTDQQRLASGVQGAGRDLLRVINDVLDFSVIQAGGVSPERVDFEIRPLIGGIVRDLSGPAREAGVGLTLSCDDDVPGALSGDPSRVAQVLANLTSNAIKFPRTGKEVMVSVRALPAPPGAPSVDRHERGSTRLRIEVRDAGIGIDPERLEHLLDPFTQADASSTRSRRPMRPRPDGSAAPVSDWPSRRRSWRRSAASSGTSPTPAGAACSSSPRPSGCR